MDFGYVLKRAWQIVWKFKVLWLFGILASCGQAGNSAGSNSGYQFSGGDSNTAIQIERFFNQLGPGEIAIMAGIGLLVLLVVIILAILFSTVGRIGLIRGTLKAEEGAQRLTFGELWRDGMAYFWRVFGLNLLIGVIIFLAVMVLVVFSAILVGVTLGIFLVCLIPLMCLIIPVMWAVYVVIEQANVALVVENLGITQAISRGWQVVWQNVGSMFVMSLVLMLAVGLIGGLIIGLPFLVVAAPVFIGYATGTTEAIWNGWIISGLCFLGYLPFLLLLSGILRAYTTSAWTLTFTNLTHRPSQSIIEAPDLTQEMVPPPAPSL